MAAFSASTVASFLAVAAEQREQFDPDTVTPGVIGFVVTFLVGAVTVLLVLDLTRRVRRSRYRAEARELLDAEEAAAAEAVGGEGAPKA